MILEKLLNKARFVKGRTQNFASNMRWKINWFDISSSVDTGTLVERENLYDSIDSPNKAYMSRYVPTDMKQLNKSLNQLVFYDKSVLHSTLIDFGCRKGRVLIIAERMGFKKVIGIEFSKKLYDICLKNIKKIKCLAVEVIHGDALEYKIPEDARVFYFYNPFEFHLFEKVLIKIRQFLKNSSQVGYIVYIDPRKFGRLNTDEYELLYQDDGPLNPYHVYKVLI